MLRKRRPVYEVNFLERRQDEGQFERRWVSAAVSGFDADSSRHEQVERVIGALGDQALEGDFTMRRMRKGEMSVLRKIGIKKGGTPISRTEKVDGLTARITYPAGEELERIKDARREAVATSMVCLEAVQQGVVISRETFGCGSGPVTREDAGKEAAELRGFFGLVYGDGDSAASSAPAQA